MWVVRKKTAVNSENAKIATAHALFSQFVERFIESRYRGIHLTVFTRNVLLTKSYNIRVVNILQILQKFAPLKLLGQLRPNSAWTIPRWTRLKFVHARWLPLLQTEYCNTLCKNIIVDSISTAMFLGFAI